MKGWAPLAAAVALALGVAAGGKASAASPAGDGSSTPGVHPVLAAAGSLGLPAGLIGAGGVLWLLFSQGKTLQENTEAWGKLSRMLRGRKGRERPQSTRIPAAASTDSSGGRRFAVGFSYAGEDRAVVAPVAERLADELSEARVLYDKFHEAELARPDLDVYLPRLYRDETDLIVVVLSPDYPRKRWCGLEWRWIRQLILGEAQERIMLLQIGNPGDLTELGIVSGDGYLDISRRSAAAISGAILERLGQQQGATGQLGLLQMPADPSQPASVAPGPWFLRGRRLAALLGGAGAFVAGGWLLGRPLLASWQLRQGDQAFLGYAKLADASQLQRATQAWQRASSLNPSEPEAHARLGFLADFLEKPTAATSHWQKAATLAPRDTPQARAIRNGLANVLAQQPDKRQEALRLYEADRFYPRSAMEAAMLRWGEPKVMPQALDAINESALGSTLTGDGPPAEPWGFKSNGELLLFESRAQQRCLLANVRAVTAHLAGTATTAASPPLANPDCQGVESSARDLLCDRLNAAAANPRAATTAGWLGCPRGTPQAAAREDSA